MMISNRNIAGVLKRAALLGLVGVTAVPAVASLSPATWVSHRLIGVKGDSWVAMRAERHFASYYRYKTRSEMHRVKVATGCRAETVVLHDSETVDESASGDWSVKTVAANPLPAGALDEMVPVVPSSWNEGIKITSGGVTLDSDDKKFVVIPAAMVAKWARLQGIAEIYDPQNALQISGMFESTDAVREGGMMFLEIETREGGDIDVDYARFIVPLAAGAMYKLLETGALDQAKLTAVQPQPTGC